MYFKRCPTLSDLESLKGYTTFQKNYPRIKRYCDLKLDFIVYGEGKVTLFRSSESVTLKQKRAVFKKFNSQCAICGKIGIPYQENGYIGYKDELGNPFQVDHIIPISFGGSRDLSNLQITCRSCNQSKKEAFYG